MTRKGSEIQSSTSHVSTSLMAPIEMSQQPRLPIREPVPTRDASREARCYFAGPPGASRVQTQLVVRRGFDLAVESHPSAPDFLDDLIGALVPDEGLGIVVPMLGPELDAFDEFVDAAETAST